MGSSVAMPRMSSTSCITGTGFMKWKPMNRSGRSVRLASRVMEMEEVLEVRIVSGFRCGTRFSKMAVFMLSRSVAASMIRSVAPRSVSVGVAPMRSIAAALSASATVPRATWRSRLRSIRPCAAPSASPSISVIRTS